MPNETNLPVGAGTRSLAIVSDANVSGEISQAGVAFGDLVETTGMAVAETQNRLNTTSADSATALASTQVDVIAVQEKQRPQRDCTPYNGPFGFYGNVWCQPPNEQSYLRNLGSRWPMETPPSLRNPKPQPNTSDW